MAWAHIEEFLQRARDLIQQGAVHYTAKGTHEIVDLGLTFEQAKAVLLALEASDFDQVLYGRHELYVFLPETFVGTLYVKLAIDQDVIVVSFHPEGQHD